MASMDGGRNGGEAEGAVDDVALRRDRRLLLVSSGLAIPELLRHLLAGRQGLTMAFIPAASYAEDYGVASRLSRWHWRALGLKVRVVDLTQRHTWRVRAELEECDLVYVCGGNSFYLMRCLRDSGAADAIRAMAARGVPYIGESAGAVVAARDIGYIAPMDCNRALRGQADPAGLGLTAYHVVPHVGGTMLGRQARKILDRHAGDHGYVPLRNDQALQVTGTKARVITTYALTPLAL
ncbi:MAG: Type 1 glutamine amidotransferase-like domain-containing protein [Bifidobacterium sp.]|nr:Type 1 glutamine amidotransferase-like domain-containing protein [Bifidobacterium sp.]